MARSASKAKRIGRKKFKHTTFGKRALAGARSGTGGIANPDGTRSSVRSATFDVKGRKGRTDVAVVPTIRKSATTGKLTRLTPPQAAKAAFTTGDYVRVKARRGETVAETRARGDKRSRKFSKKLGRISAKVARKRGKV